LAIVPAAVAVARRSVQAKPDPALGAQNTWTHCPLMVGGSHEPLPEVVTVGAPFCHTMMTVNWADGPSGKAQKTLERPVGVVESIASTW
jgi:hypothetical protein